MLNRKLIFNSFIIVLLGGCTSNYMSYNKQSAETEPKVINTSWDNLVTIVKTGNYQSLGQQHDKTVRLVLNDGSVLQAKEPTIDDIYQVVQNCPKCSGKPFMTE